MKTIISMMTLIMFLSFSSANAQEQAGKSTPANVKAAFAKLYPNVKDATWRMEEKAYEAKFTENGKEISVHFNKNGDYLEKEYYMKVSELPQTAQDYLTKHYQGVNITEASKIVTAKGVTLYEAETKDKDIMFDDKGNFTKEVKEAPGEESEK